MTTFRLPFKTVTTGYYEIEGESLEAVKAEVDKGFPYELGERIEDDENTIWYSDQIVEPNTQKHFVAWASVTETIKYYFDASSQGEADKLIAQVNAGVIDISELHNGNYSLKGVEVTSDYAEEA